MKEYLPWISMGLTVLGFVIGYLKWIVSIEGRLIKLETKMDLFWTAIEGPMKAMLKQPIHFRKDELLDRFPNLSDEEMEELKGMLEKEREEYVMSKDHKALYAALMVSRINEELQKRRNRSSDRGCRTFTSLFNHLLCYLHIYKKW